MKAVATDPPTFELNEWEPAVVLPGVQLGERDRLLAAALAERESRLIVDEVRAGVRVRPTSWVGVIRFEDFEVRVVPKLVGGNLGVIEMIDYASGLGALARFSAVRRLSVASTGRLVDLLGLLLAESSERLVRDGLLQDYVAHEEALPVVRGRLLAAEQVQRHFGRIDRLECRFDELETDILENRLVTVGLALARRVCGDPEVRRRLARVHGVFDDACTTIGLEPAAIIGDVTYQRRNSHYRTAHAYARYFIERLGVAAHPTRERQPDRDQPVLKDVRLELVEPALEAVDAPELALDLLGREQAPADNRQRLLVRDVVLEEAISK